MPRGRYPLKEAIRLAYEDGLITKEDMLQKQMTAAILTPIVAKLNHLIAHRKKIVKFVVNEKSKEVMLRYFEEFCQRLEKGPRNAGRSKKKRIGGFRGDMGINKNSEKKMIVTNLMMKIQGVVKQLSDRVTEIVVLYFNRLGMPETDVDETTQFISDILNEVFISISNHIDEVIHIAVIEAAFKKTRNDDDSESIELAETDEDEINENDLNYSNKMETDEEDSDTECQVKPDDKKLEESNEIGKDDSDHSFNDETNQSTKLDCSNDSKDHDPKEGDEDVLDLDDETNPKTSELENTSYMEIDHNSYEEEDDLEEVEESVLNHDAQTTNASLAIESHLDFPRKQKILKQNKSFECNIFDSKLQFDVDRDVCQMGSDLKEIMKFSVREGYKNYNKTCCLKYKSFRMRNNKTITAYAYCSVKSCTTFKFTGSVDGTINVYRNGDICHREDDSDVPKKPTPPMIEPYIEPEYVYVNNVFKK